MIFTFRLKGWLMHRLRKEMNRSRVIRKALEMYYRRDHDGGNA
jgi:hypothetical protein